MKRKWFKKSGAVLLAVTMILSAFSGFKGTVHTVYAAENMAPENEYWTDVDGLKAYNMSSLDTPVGKIKFGEAGGLWAICGVDFDADQSLALLETLARGVSDYGYYSSNYSTSNILTYLLSYKTRFTIDEIYQMKPITITTNEVDIPGVSNHEVSLENQTLYIPNSKNENSIGETTIYVGTNNNIPIDLKKLTKTIDDYFWLRSPNTNTDSDALIVSYNSVYYIQIDVLLSVFSAFNLDLSSVNFASAVDAAASTGATSIPNSAMTERTYTLRYVSKGEEKAEISADGTSVTVTNGNGKHLMVQNSDGVYSLFISEDSKTVNASETTITGTPLENFNNCKVWLESTTERITTAKLAAQQVISVAVTDITVPVAESDLDTVAACAITGVSEAAPTVSWTPSETTAGYNTAYTASVTLTPSAGYAFTDSTTATVNGNTATSVTKNLDGTLTVTYEFLVTPKPKLLKISTPTGLIVTNQTAYHAMGLPSTVAITTEGNVVTSAQVSWNTTTPASGSYDPSLLLEQTVTLNGAVTCPENIDPNGVSLTTTITVTISAAGIVGSPTFTPAGGTYTDNQFITLSTTTDSATIYYTTDGTDPTTGSNVYSAPISITGVPGESKSTTIKAIAVKNGMQPSNVVSATYMIELPATTNTVTVNNGDGDGSYVANATVTITADAAPNGMVFDRWLVVSGGVTLADATSTVTSFSMPANAVEVTATYKAVTPPAPSTYTVTVNNGSGAGSYSANETVIIRADAAPNGMVFDQWIVVSGGVTLADATSTVTSFSMPANVVEVTATYKVVTPPAPSTYTVTVNNGDGDGSYVKNATVTITADAAPNGMVFDKWLVVSGGVTLADATSTVTSFSMPANAVEVTATYKAVTPPAPSTFAVTVNNGAGDGGYAANEIVTITADTATNSKVFDKWLVVSGGVTLADATSTVTSFSMPANAVEVTATYKENESNPTPTYTVTEGAGGTHQLRTDGSLTITCDGTLDKLTGIYVDDNLLVASNYTLTSGSTILTLNADYLNTLSVGIHTLRFQYSDGYVDTIFTISAAADHEETTSSQKDDVPKTGDNTPITWLFLLAIISGFGVVYFGRKKKTVR